MSTQISQHSGGGQTLQPRPLGGGGPPPPVSSPFGGPPIPSSSPFNQKQLIGLSSDKMVVKTERTLVKTERNVDDGVDLSFDTSVKKENFEIKMELNVETLVKTEQENEMNSSPRTPNGGRLKFFKEGRVLLELTHRCVSDGEKVSWVPTGSKKVYWPPGPTPLPGPAPLTSRLDSNASNHTVTGSDGSIESGSYSSIPPHSPWGTPSPRPVSWQPSPPHRVKSTPVRLCDPHQDLLFAMRPPQGVRNYRKKIRTFRRKCRQPESDIKIGMFILKMECQSAVPKPKKRVVVPQPASARNARLETVIAKIITRKSLVHVPISAWRSGRTDLQNLVKNPPSNPGSPSGPRSSPLPKGYPAHPGPKYPSSPGMRIKSELKMVTETCTSTLTSISSPPRHSAKVKAETRTVTAETRSIPVRTLPITPTVARVKSEPDGGHRLKASAITSLMSPELARIRMEIGPAQHERDQSFVSPRKRYLREFENGGGSPAKNRRLSTEHRLSTDSLGSTGDRSSPYRGPGSPQPPSRPGTKAPFSSFSIDSLISGSQAPSSPSRLVLRRESGTFHPVPRSQPTPGSPSRGHMLATPTPNRPSPTPARTPPPQHLGYPFMYPHHPLLAQQALLDPRLAHLAALSQASPAHLAALSASPAHLAALSGGSPFTGGVPYPFNLYQSFNPYLAASTAYTPPTPAPTVWTPPVATPTPPNSISSQRETPTPTRTLTSPNYPPPITSMPQTSVYAPTASIPPHPVSAPRPVPVNTEKIQDAHKQPETLHFQSVQSHSVDDAPLNLSMKPTSL